MTTKSEKRAMTKAAAPVFAPDANDATSREAYLKKMEAQGKEWEGQMALWGSKADQATAEVKAEFQRWQKEFSNKKTAAYRRLEAVRNARDNAWEEMRTGAESAWTELRGGFETAKKKYQ